MCHLHKLTSAFVRASFDQGVFAFWAASPDTTNGDVVLHWITEGVSELSYRQGETRCVLVSSVTSTAITRMYASLEPCTAKLADGVLTVAAAAAPPPPPGSTDQHLFDPLRAPPPPPSIKSHAWTIYKREKLFSFTEAVCSGVAGEGHIHRDLCTKFLDEIGRFQFISGVGTVAPLCDRVCWHSCIGEHLGGEDHDDFNNCRQTECAESSCYDFLIRECDPIQHAAITTKYKELCTIVSCLRACPVYQYAPLERVVFLCFAGAS